MTLKPVPEFLAVGHQPDSIRMRFMQGRRKDVTNNSNICNIILCNMCFQLKTVKAANLQMQEFKRQFDETSRLQIMPYLQVIITPKKDEKRADGQCSLFDFVMHGK